MPSSKGKPTDQKLHDKVTEGQSEFPSFLWQLRASRGFVQSILTFYFQRSSNRPIRMAVERVRWPPGKYVPAISSARNDQSAWNQIAYRLPSSTAAYHLSLSYAIITNTINRVSRLRRSTRQREVHMRMSLAPRTNPPREPLRRRAARMRRKRRPPIARRMTHNPKMMRVP